MGFSDYFNFSQINFTHKKIKIIKPEFYYDGIKTIYQCENCGQLGAEYDINIRLTYYSLPRFNTFNKIICKKKN